MRVLISKFFNFDEIKKQVLALIAFFTLTNSAYTVKRGGANENAPMEGNDYKTKLELYKDPTVPYIYPYIFDEDIIIDGYNIFVTMKTKFEAQFRTQFRDTNRRNPANDLEFNKYCLNRILNELSRCCKGKIHLIIKTGQDNTLGNILYKHHDAIDAGIGDSVIVYDASYDDEELVQNIRTLSAIENPDKKQKKDLHRLKSLDDHLLMMIANKYLNAKIISFDKYREIRLEKELPNNYKIYTQTNNMLETSTVIPSIISELLRKNIFENDEKPFHTRVMFPLCNEDGNIIMFGKYTNGYLDFSYGQELFKETIDVYMKNLYKFYTELLENIVRNQNQYVTIHSKFYNEFEAKNMELQGLNFDGIAIYNQIRFHEQLDVKVHTCIERMRNLQRSFYELYSNPQILFTDIRFYNILPNAQEIIVRHGIIDIDHTAVNFDIMRRL